MFFSMHYDNYNDNDLNVRAEAVHKSCTIWPDTTAGLTLQKDVANEQYRLEWVFRDHTYVLTHDDDHSTSEKSTGIPSPPTCTSWPHAWKQTIFSPPRSVALNSWCSPLLSLSAVSLASFCCYTLNWNPQIILYMCLPIWSKFTVV